MSGSGELESFYRSTHPRLWAYLTSVTGDRGLAEEVAQEAFVRLLGSRAASLAADERRAYLFRIGENLVRDEMRRRRREPARRTDDEGEAVGNQGGGLAGPHAVGAQAVDADRALRAVSPRQRRLLWLAYVEGCSHSEIARILRLAPGSVRVLLHRARRGFIAAYRGEAPDDPRP